MEGFAIELLGTSPRHGGLNTLSALTADIQHTFAVDDPAVQSERGKIGGRIGGKVSAAVC